MGKCTGKFPYRSGRQYRVGVNRYYKSDVGQRSAIAFVVGKKPIITIDQQSVELLELSPLSFPRQPAIFSFVILAGTEQQVKRADTLLSMPLVECLDFTDELCGYFIVSRHMLGWRVHQISKQSKLKISVAVGKPMGFDLLDEIRYLAGLSDQDRHYRNRFAVCGQSV
ncbi:hypothetical protein [Parasphingorhabdus sp.]